MTLRLTLDSAQLAGRTGRGVRIAVIDSGVAADHPHVGGVAGGVSFVSTADAADFRDRHGHGTAVAAAIREKAPDAQLYAVRVFDRVLATSAETLAHAIDRAAEHGAQLINLSLGTPNEQHRETLRAALHRALRQGAFVVAAADNDGVPMFPGALPGAIAVRLDADCPRDALILDAEQRLRASGYPRPIPGVPPERNLYGISFAVANATGVLARLLEGRNVKDGQQLLGMFEPR